MEQLALKIRPSRRRSATNLPALPSLNSLSEGWGNPDHRVILLTDCLRRAAEDQRGKIRCPFYSIRAVAGHFGVTPTTVSRIYERLKRDGLLTSIWGSSTFVEPTRPDKELRVRAIIALPVSLSSFRLLEDYREFFFSIEDTLWKHGFATRLAFHDSNLGESPEFTEILLKHKPDFVLWLYPTSKNLSIAARLVDSGVRLVTIGKAPTSNYGYSYVTDQLAALRECLTFREDPPNKPILIVRQSDDERADRHGTIEAMLREMRIPCSSISLKSLLDEDHPLRMTRLDQRTVIFSSSVAIAHLFSKRPSALQALFTDSHVILAEGPVDLPDTGFEAKNVDVIRVDWPQAARRIARDLTAMHDIAPKRPVSLNAHWLPAISCQKPWNAPQEPAFFTGRSN